MGGEGRNGGERDVVRSVGASRMDCNDALLWDFYMIYQCMCIEIKAEIKRYNPSPSVSSSQCARQRG